MSDLGHQALFAAPPILPLLLVLWLTLFPRSRLIALAPWLAAPALPVLGLPDGTLADYRWLWLGLQLGLDETNRPFLLLAAVVWLASGVYARSYLAEDPDRLRYTICHLLCMAGSFGLVLSQEAISFYAGFALMSLVAFGLVVHSGTRRSRRAAIIYLVMAVAGEIMLFAGIVLAVSVAESVYLDDVRIAVASPLTVFLLIGGFGVKAGLPGLHFWLPLAHPVAPTPASAVLSGVMIKAGLLGWLRFLPVGDVAMPQWGGLLLGLGLAGAFYGALRGLKETDAKTILAYSSVSQMGLMTSLVAVGLLAPHAWPALWAALSVYVLHHALTKGALFLGVGVCAATARRRFRAGLAMVVMLVLAGSLSGLPLTSGFLAKTSVKDALTQLDSAQAQPLSILFSLAAVGTTLLMIRFLHQLQFSVRPRVHGAGLRLPWIGLAIVAPILCLGQSGLDGANLWSRPWPSLWPSLWPIALALGLWWLVRYGVIMRRRHGHTRAAGPGRGIRWSTPEIPRTMFRHAHVRWQALQKQARRRMDAVGLELSRMVSYGETQALRWSILVFGLLILVSIGFAAMTGWLR